MNNIERFTLETVTAISKLVKENLYTQALVILYSAIDTLAWANLPDGDVAQKDFIAWVDKYIEPERKFSCTAVDLYGARCGLVHSSAAESKKSRKGESSELWYATSPSSIVILREYANKKNERAKVIYFTDLLEAFVNGSQTFCEEINYDTKRQQCVNERIKHWIRFVPITVVR